MGFISDFIRKQADSDRRDAPLWCRVFAPKPEKLGLPANDGGHSLSARPEASGFVRSLRARAGAWGCATGHPNRARSQTPLRSYTQADLDAAIREYKARRVPRYRELVEAVQSGRKGAIKCAQKIFGRNAISRALGVRARAMVSKSEPWLEIAEELQLPRKNLGARGIDKQKRIGTEIACERKAQGRGNTVIAEVIQNETVALAREHLPRALAESLIQTVEAGRMDDDKARQVIELYQDQQKDDRATTINQTP